MQHSKKKEQFVLCTFILLKKFSSILYLKISIKNSKNYESLDTIVFTCLIIIYNLILLSTIISKKTIIPTTNNNQVSPRFCKFCFFLP